MSDSLLSLQSVTKDFRSYWTFRALRAVENVSLDVAAGETFGFLGHNGAGKTTTIKCILGLVRLTSGSIRYRGQSLTNPALRAEIGYLPEQPYFYEHLNVEETLRFFADLLNIPRHEVAARIAEVLALLGLDSRRRIAGARAVKRAATAARDRASNSEQAQTADSRRTLLRP